ncbi:hypothetical protein Bwad001_10680 [Bilophila wadsworthia]
MEPWRVPSRHTVKDGLSTWETMEKTLRAVRLALRGARATGRGAFPVGVGEERLRAPGYAACACPGRARRHGASHAPANRDQGDPAVGTRPRHGKRGLIGLADGAARRSHGEAVRTGRPRG